MAQQAPLRLLHGTTKNIDVNPALAEYERYLKEDRVETVITLRHFQVTHPFVPERCFALSDRSRSGACQRLLAGLRKQQLPPLGWLYVDAVSVDRLPLADPLARFIFYIMARSSPATTGIIWQTTVLAPATRWGTETVAQIVRAADPRVVIYSGVRGDAEPNEVDAGGNARSVPETPVGAIGVWSDAAVVIVDVYDRDGIRDEPIGRSVTPLLHAGAKL